jgi:hypothetical protein
VGHSTKDPAHRPLNFGYVSAVQPVFAWYWIRQAD